MRHAMAIQDPETMIQNEDDEAITRGTGNIFADLGYSDAETRQIKLRLAHAIDSVIVQHGLTQAVAAEKLGVTQPKVTALANYKLDGFSVERLMIFLTALDQDVEIIIRSKPESRSSGRITVIAA
jgi:predicted XRE-type DNA-binding protein